MSWCMGTKNRAAGAAAVVLSLMLVLAGCGGTESSDSGISEASQQIIDDFADVILSMDQDSAEFDAALESVGVYAESGDSEDLAAARETIAETITLLEETSDSLVEYEMDEDFEDLLSEAGIDSEDYLYYAQSERPYMLEEYVYDLEILDSYLEMMEDSDVIEDDFQFMYQYIVDNQALMREYYYWSVNYWFAGWNEEEVSYIQEQILDNLVSFSSDSEDWDDDQESVETRLTAVLDEIEALLYDISEHIGTSQEALYDLTD